MTNSLDGKKIAFLVANGGVEQVELNGYALVTSRKPDGLDAFDKAIVELFG